MLQKEIRTSLKDESHLSKEAIFARHLPPFATTRHLYVFGIVDSSSKASELKTDVKDELNISLIFPMCSPEFTL